MSSLPTTSFVSRRVNPSTFVVSEDDDFGEQPYIYIKIYAKFIVVTDSGCNKPRNKDVQISSLRQYIEEYPIASNSNASLNPGGEKAYIIICSHCHYDHILGLPQFLSSNPTIIASELGKYFILQDLPEHSLCKYLDIPTPRYDVSRWAGQFEYFSMSNTHFRIQFLQIPGHTPDSLAWYDIDEHYLYIGDTLYTRQRSPPIPELPDDAGQVPGIPSTQAAIIFPEEGGNWIQYMASLNLLRYFVKHRNAELERQHSSAETAAPRVLLACGHLTYGADAEAMVLEVQELFQRIIAGKVAVRSSSEKRGIIYDYWLESDESCYGVTAPRHLAEEARKHFHGTAL
ncbi:Metallo-beta-lactamase domain-containing 2 protein [Rutstroemia sp. NJR-2017a WRK4]|nr:Metallo-beta-lactamase domain-containing 2 protein [Rutstroemia sp. NJR-2017a WRK4]